jgi:uncharacterized protein YukE
MKVIPQSLLQCGLRQTLIYLKSLAWVCCLACLLWVAGVISQDAVWAATSSRPAAITSNPAPSLPIAQPQRQLQPVGQQIEQKVSSALQQSFQQAQTAFDQSVRNTQSALQGLPQRLEEAAGTTTAQLRQELETRKDFLDDAADAIDSLGKKIEKFAGSLSQAPSIKIKQVFDTAADAIEVVADDIEDAAKGKVTLSQAQINQRIQAVNQALDQAKQSLQNLSQNAA